MYSIYTSSTPNSLLIRTPSQTRAHAKSGKHTSILGTLQTCICYAITNRDDDEYTFFFHSEFVSLPPFRPCVGESHITYMYTILFYIAIRMRNGILFANISFFFIFEWVYFCQNTLFFSFDIPERGEKFDYISIYLPLKPVWFSYFAKWNAERIFFFFNNVSSI